jgi:quercetin dioxygenase-like cupin family protein
LFNTGAEVNKMLAKVASWMLERQHKGVLLPPADLHENLQRLREMSKDIPPHPYPKMRRIEDALRYQEFELGTGIGFTKCLFDEPGITSVAHTIFKEHTEFPLHQHNEQEILIVLKGSLLLSRKDEMMMLAPGAVAILPPMAEHGAVTPTGCEFLAITIPDSPEYPKKLPSEVSGGR